MNNKEVTEYRNNLKERVARIETTIGIELPHISNSLGRIDKNLNKLNDRTSTLEGWKNWLAGGMALLVVVITIAIGVL